MPTRKQRRRQEKLRRHEWEEVWVDDEGEEIEPPPEVAATAAKKAAPTTRRSAPAPVVEQGSTSRGDLRPDHVRGRLRAAEEVTSQRGRRALSNSAPLPLLRPVQLPDGPRDVPRVPAQDRHRVAAQEARLTTAAT